VIVGWLAAAALLLWVVRGVARSKQRNRRQLPSDSIGGLPNLLSKAAMTAVVAGWVWFVCCVPLPRWVYVDVQVQPTRTQTLFATSNGFVDMAKLPPGDVKTDQAILDLLDPELSHQCSIAEIEAKRAISQVKQLQRQAQQLPELNETLAAVTEQAKSKQVRFDQLRSQLRDLALVSSICLNRDKWFAVVLIVRPTRYKTVHLAKFWLGSMTRRQSLGRRHSPTIATPIRLQNDTSYRLKLLRCQRNLACFQVVELVLRSHRQRCCLV